MRLERRSNELPWPRAERAALALSWLWLAGATGCLGDDPAVAIAGEAAPLRVNAPPLPRGIDRWQYTEIEGAYCRDGSAAGVAVNAHAGATRLMIYLEQGGACFNEETCALNPSSVALDLIALGLITGADGLFNRQQAENPLRDWNFVYVPYCTGDLHMGVRPDGLVPNVGPQKFVGFDNMKLFLPRIAATFPGPSQVLLTGASAGGMGTFGHLENVQDTFPEVRVAAVDDAGPQLSAALFQRCLQEHMREYWGLSESWLALCGAACSNQDDSLQDFAVHLGQTFGDRPLGYLVGASDASLRSFASLSKNDCTGTADPLNPAFTAQEMTDDLLLFRRKVEPFANFNTFFPDDDQHTYTSQQGFYTIRAGGMKLSEWFAAIAAGQNPGHFGP
jgi:hypothetical protein